MSGLRLDFHIANVESFFVLESIRGFQSVKEKRNIVDVIFNFEFPLVASNLMPRGWIILLSDRSEQLRYRQVGQLWRPSKIHLVLYIPWHDSCLRLQGLHRS
jgi:hypothetical protein